MYAFSLTIGIIAAVLAIVMVLFGEIAGKKFFYIVGIGHIVCVLVMTICCLADSYSACTICCGIVGGISVFFLLGILVWYKKQEIYYKLKSVRLWIWVCILIDFISAMICDLWVYKFLDAGITCLVCLIIGVICLIINKRFEVAVKILNVVFCVASLVFSIIGFAEYGISRRPLECEVSCEVYEYDVLTAETGDKVSGDLETNNYYAMQFVFDWDNTISLANNPKQMRICVDFSALSSATVGYVSEGLAFNNDTGSVWTCNFTADLNIKKFNSGFFIVNCNNVFDLTGVTKSEVPIKVSVFEDDDKEELISSREFVYIFIQRV